MRSFLASRKVVTGCERGRAVIGGADRLRSNAEDRGEGPCEAPRPGSAAEHLLAVLLIWRKDSDNARVIVDLGLSLCAPVHAPVTRLRVVWRPQSVVSCAVRVGED